MSRVNGLEGEYWQGAFERKEDIWFCQDYKQKESDYSFDDSSE